MAEVKFFVLTDSHYVSKKTWVEGKPFTFRERSDQIALKLSPEILDAFLEKVIADKETDTVLFLGDNVNNCDMLSHEEFRQRLERLVGEGKKVYVIYATHDYSGLHDDKNRFIGYRFTEKGKDWIDSMKKGELFDYYYDYGAKQALNVHKGSGSYTVKLGEKLRLIMIIDNGDGRSYCGLDDDGLDWVRSEIKNAKAHGDYVIAAVHHPVLPPWDIYGFVVNYELFGGYKKLCEILCEEKVRVIFTGHTHVQNIRKYTDKKGRWFFDISTTALVNAAGKMRKVTVDTESGICDVKSIGIDKIDGVDTGEQSLYEYLYHLNFPGIWEVLVPLAATDFNEFLKSAEGYLPTYIIKDYESVITFVSKTFLKMRLSSVSMLSKEWLRMSPKERNEAKNKKLSDSVFEMMRHFYTGNGPFGPETVDNKALTYLFTSADRAVKLFNIKPIKKVIPTGSSLKEVAEDFLYNTRTGNDDEITFSLE